MKHEDLTQRIIGICFDVSNELGAGFVESVYHRAVEIALTEQGFRVESEKSLSVHFRSRVVGQFFADLVVNETVLLELKAVKSLLPEHHAQVINYLKATGIEVGLLINFGCPKMEVKRLHP